MTSAARHEPETLLANVLHEIKSANSRLDERDNATRARLSNLEASINDLMRKQGRPGGNGLGETDARKSALELLEQKYYHVQTKHDFSLPEPSFSEQQIDEAKLAIRGIKQLMHSTSIDQVQPDCRKALSAFSFGSVGFILAPEQSNEILSCLEDVGDLTGLMRNISISSSSI